MGFVVIRLGKDSLDEIQRFDADIDTINLPFSFEFSCKQVQDVIDVNDYCFIWLGSDNSNGQPTEWKQGIRGFGRIDKLERGQSFNSVSRLVIEVLSILPHSLDQFNFLEKNAIFYKHFSAYPVVGVKTFRNNAIQFVNEGPRQNTSALLTAIKIQFGRFEVDITSRANNLLPMLSFAPVFEVTSGESPSYYDEDDDWYSLIAKRIFENGERNFMFLGAPGTGKTWHAHRLAKRFSDNSSERHRFIQLHPSFSYDDFVEGYVPNLNSGGALSYELTDKHLLVMSERARNDSDNIYVLVIDEFSRGDPSRIFGELLTYIETGYRDQEFSLSYSGKTISIPTNLVIFVTANPYDRSVGEIDDALLRRFVVYEFHPDSEILCEHLLKNDAEEPFVSRIKHVFSILNENLPNGFGHANFWNIRNLQQFEELWATRIKFTLKRSLQFDENTYETIVRDVEQTMSISSV